VKHRLNFTVAKDFPRLSSKGSRSFLTLVLPTIGNVFFVSLLFILIFKSGQVLLTDGDTGYHIRTGEIILREWRVPTHDPYSFHAPALKWTAHEWLSEAIMAKVFQISGLTGIVLFFSSLLALTHWLLYRSLRARSANSIMLCALVTLLATATSSTHWLARPHVFSLLFTVIWCHCLDRFQYQNDARLIYLMPALMLAWVNLHGGFILGLVILALYLGGNCLYALTGIPSEQRQHRSKARELFFLFLGLLAICSINPHGIDILWFPFRFASDRFTMDRVTEALSPNFHEALPYKYMLLALIAALTLSRRSLNVIEASLVVLLSYMSLYSVRHVSLFAIIVSPILVKVAESALTRLPGKIFESYQQRNSNLAAIDRRLNGYLWPAVSLVFACALALSGSVKFQFDSKTFPVAAVEFLKKEPITGNMFNNDEFGDYLIFAAWPAYRVFIDGRSDMYGAKYESSYFTIAQAQRGWKAELDKYNITWVIFDTESPLTAALHDQQDWQPIYSDRIATIMVKKTPGHTNLLAKYASVRLAPP
jgi:hypothetical protein